MPASTELISICRSQVALLVKGMGAAAGVVYLTERLVEEGTTQDKLIPVVAYPETAVRWEGLELSSAALPAATGGSNLPQLQAEIAPKHSVSLPELSIDADVAGEPLETAARALVPSQQIVLPLLHEGVLIGLLVTSREDRAWNERERHEIERVAQTLTLARLLDRRRERSEQQLSQQKQLQAQQRELLDNLLHQFRNPLTALRTFGKLLLKRLLPGDANRAVADNIVRESDRLQELLQQFDRVIDMTGEDLESTKSLPPAAELRSATVPLVNSPLPLLSYREGDRSQVCKVEDVLKPLLASAWAIAQERNLDLQADLPPNLPAVRANVQELPEVLSNLLDNAIKYTPPRGKIYVQAGLERENFQGIAISDTGVGISSQDLERIFERRYRGKQAESDIPGTGLGLAIAKASIEQMQGKIEVFSPALWHPESEGSGGTTFIVWLPMEVGSRE
jgi:signal transduction histidine kinase